MTNVSLKSDPVQTKAAGLSAINVFFLLFLLGGVLCGAFTGRMKEVNDASFQSAKDAVTLAISLIGIMAFWLGMVRILEAGGLMYRLANGLRPLMVRLFPDVPPEHPAMGAMVLNIAANVLGLGNAATPFGIKAILELNKLNPLPGTATNAMCLFLAINTSGVTILPLGMINLRAAAGAARPVDIFLPTLIATAVSTVVGAMVAIFFARLDTKYRLEAAEAAKKGAIAGESAASAAGGTEPDTTPNFDQLKGESNPTYRAFGWGIFLLFLVAGVIAGARATTGVGVFLRNEFMSYWLMPGLILAILLYGLGSGVKVYEAVTDGAKQGFDTAVRIIPYLVAMLVAVAIFRASGAMEFLASIIDPVTTIIGLPTEVVPVALVRSLSGSGAFGIISTIVQADPNSFNSYLASTLMGAHDTTFYILAVYFGAAGVVRIRHALFAGIIADVTGTLTACVVCQAMWQPV